MTSKSGNKDYPNTVGHAMINSRWGWGVAFSFPSWGSWRCQFERWGRCFLDIGWVDEMGEDLSFLKKKLKSLSLISYLKLNWSRHYLYTPQFYGGHYLGKHLKSFTPPAPYPLLTIFWSYSPPASTGESISGLGAFDTSLNSKSGGRKSGSLAGFMGEGMEGTGERDALEEVGESGGSTGGSAGGSMARSSAQL